MGGTSSTSNSKTKRSDKRVYLLPHVRAKDRFNPVDTSQFASQYDPSVDKYDLLIIFPMTEGPYKDPIIATGHEAAFIKWDDIEQQWEKSTPGSVVDKLEAVTDLKQFWKKRTGEEPKPTDKIRLNAWLTIAREAIIDKLMNKCGLQLKLSANKHQIFCRIRAPIRLLEIQADKDNYPLQIRGEIDPGSEKFWNLEYDGKPIELEEENRIYSLEEAKIILERLYRAGKISAGDITINPEEENEESWSIRVHALERIADRVPIENPYIPYATILSGKPHLRYLFQTYPSVRGMTLFKSKDRLYLTKAIIETAFDFAIMQSQFKIITHFFALHDANRGEKLTVTSLAESWVTFWRVSYRDVGAPTVTHPAYHQEGSDAGKGLYFWDLPFSQPLQGIRDYFGEKVAMYYAWLGHFTYYLTFPALLGVAIEVYYIVRGYQVDVHKLDYSTYVYYLCVLTWSMIYVQCWKRECYAIALKWGTRGYETEEKDRPEYYGESQRSPVTNEMELVYPEETRRLTQIGSCVVIFVLIVFDLLLLYGIFYLEYILKVNYSVLKDSVWFTIAIALFLASSIQCLTYCYQFIARALNDLENHRTETDYEDTLVMKSIAFEVINTFGACMFVAFLKGFIFPGTCYIDCFIDLRTLLYMMIVVRVVKNGFLVVSNWIDGYMKSIQHRLGGGGGGGGGGKKEGTVANERTPLLGGGSSTAASAASGGALEDTQFMLEVYKDDSPSTYDDGQSVFTQFAFINLFSIILPILSLVSLLENLVKIRVDAYKLCSLCKRPHVELAEDAGYWSETMEYMIYLGIYLNIAMVFLAFPDMSGYSELYRLIFLFVFAQCLFVYVYMIQTCFLPSEPDYITEISARHAFVIDKYVKGFEDKNESAEELGIFTSEVNRGFIDDRIDVDALNIYDLRKGQKIDDSQFEYLENLENKRRELLQELKIYRDRLTEVYKYESYNEVTGVGETKLGLALGRLSVKIVQISEFDTNLINRKDFSFKIRVEIRGTKLGSIAPIHKLPSSVTDTAVYLMPEDGQVEINQSLGPFAPIKTIDAEISFHLLFVDKDRPSDAPQATVTLPLRDLENQKQHDKILKWKIRDPYANLLPSTGTLYVNVMFQYSKVVPIRNDIYKIQDQLRTVEAALVKVKSGKE